MTISTRWLISSSGIFALINIVHRSMSLKYNQIVALLQPGRRARDEARGRVRALLAMEAHLVDNVEVSERGIDRIEKAIKAGQAFGNVFPRLNNLTTRTEGEGIDIKVHFTKKQGAPVHFVGADDPGDAAAVREVDLRKKYHLDPSNFAAKLGLTVPKAAALKWYLGIDENAANRYIFEHGKMKFPNYSDNAATTCKDWLAEHNIAEAWAAYKAK